MIECWECGRWCDPDEEEITYEVDYDPSGHDINQVAICEPCWEKHWRKYAPPPEHKEKMDSG